MSGDGSPAAETLDQALGAVGDHMTEAARECAQAVKLSFRTALDRGYTSEELAKDVAGYWARGVRDWARAWTDLALVANAVAGLSSAPSTGGTGTETPPPPPGTAPAGPPAEGPA